MRFLNKVFLISCGMFLTACANVSQTLNEATNSIVKAVEEAAQSSKSSIGTNSESKEIYTPISGKGEIAGLFAKQDYNMAGYGKIPYPRVALNFLKYGASLECWTVEATIWRSASKSSEETFEICNKQILLKDELGNAITPSPQNIGMSTNRLRNSKPLPRIPNTGTERTRGPLPPLLPLKVNISDEESMYGRPTLYRQYGDIILRIAYISNYIIFDDGAAPTAFVDYRLWTWKFDPAGNVDKK